MRASHAAVLVGIAIAWLASSVQAIAQSGSNTYSVKPSDVRLGPDDAPGSLRRTIQPFENWTLICDENLKKKQRVCNVSQIIVDPSGNTIFSWSLAGTQGGQPIMIVRAPTAGGKETVRLDFGKSRKPIDIALQQCSEQLCIGFLPVGGAMKKLIADGVPARVRYEDRGGTVVAFEAPVKGLSAALGGLK